MELTAEQQAELDKPYKDLNTAPAGDSLKDIVVDEPVAEVIAPETTTVVTPEPSEEESKVPYSRFKKFHDAAQEAAQEAAYWKGVAEARENQPATTTTETTLEVPDYWKKMYGDESSENWALVQEAWKVQKQATDEMISQARKEAIEAVRNAQGEEEQAVAQNISVLDEQFDSLTDKLGRELTEKEHDNVLDIVDEYTPKDADGNYAGAIMPIEKAWEIYELKANAGKAPKVQARNQVASLTATQTQGEPSITEQDKNFNPQDWGAWRKRLGG